MISRTISHHLLRTLLSIFLFPATVGAATINVTTTDGSGVNVNGDCSLAEALVASNFNVSIDSCAAGSAGQDTIAFSSGLFVPPFSSASITLQQSLDIADGGVVIEPPAGSTLIIGGAGSNRLFTVSAGDTILRRVTLSGGATSGDGGAILINAPSDDASLQLENVFGNNNSADGIGGFIGGDVDTGIFNLNVFSSSFSSNTSNGFTTTDDIGGGVIGIDVPRSFGFLNVFIDDSTFSTNAATNSHGGAVALYTSSLEGASFGLRITNSVFNENFAEQSGGAVYLDEERSQNGYFATFENNRFSANSAGRAGAIFANHAPIDGASSDALVLDRNSFLGNDGGLRAGAVEVIFIDTLIRNNLFAQNTSGTAGTDNAGALRIDHDGAGNSTVSDGGADVRANTFMENVGNPNDMRMDMPLTGAGAAGPNWYEGNVIQGLINGRINCDINNFPNGNFNASNIPVECTVGGSSIDGVPLAVQMQMVTHPVHTSAAIPSRSSPVVDLWPELNCRETIGGSPLAEDLLGTRRDPFSGLPPDGDGDMSADCDAGSIELAAAFELVVNLSGTGSGTVVSDVNGIDCPGDCSEPFADGSMVELFANPDPGNDFAGWSGDCAGTGTCVVTMNQARSVTATFEPSGETLTVMLDGNGTGRVTSSPAGIDCPGTCSFTFASGTVVDLSATADAGSDFLNWAGDCVGSTCQVTIDETRIVIAIFGDGDLLFLDGFE